MLPTSLQIPPATGIIQSSQEPVPASVSLVAGETLLEQLTLSRELFPSEVRQAMRGLYPGLQQGDTPDIRITPALSDGSQVRVDVSRAGEVTLSVVVAGDTTRSVVVIPTHPAWGHLCAIPEQQRLINEWSGWANEPCPEQDKRMQAREAMLECLLSGGKELKLNGLELTSLPQHFPPGLTVLDVSNNKLSRLPELPRTLSNLDASFNMLTSLPRYPDGLQELDINHNKLNLLPALPPGLKTLNASDNAFTRLPLLPEGMTEIDASNNRLTTLQKLPRSLISKRLN